MEGTPLRILAQTAYPPTVASARVRVVNHGPFLARLGISLDYQPALDEGEYALLLSPSSPLRKAAVLAASASRVRRAPRCDLKLIHRLRLLAPFPGLDPPRTLDVYDFDDALFLGSAAPVNRRFAWAKQEARRCIACLRRARLVLAGNAFLADVARRHARWVEVVPSCVDPERQPVHSHQASEVLTAGWLGSHTTSPYLAQVLPVFARLNERRTRVRLVVIGADTGVRADWIEHRPWSLERERADLAALDIGVMPLPDTDWARGKCGYKLLQYFAAGVPAVASPVGVSREMIGGDHGLLASTSEEWLAALARLSNDADERRERGAAARAFVEREYSYQRWAPELATVLRSLTR